MEHFSQINRTNDNVETADGALRHSSRTKIIERFLSNLLTKDEQEHFAQRISIAKELIHSTSVDETARKIKASTSTVSDVMRVIKHGTGGYRKIPGNDTLRDNKKINFLSGLP